MPQIGVRDVTNEDPAHFENAFPFIRSPNGTAACVVHRCQHFRHAAKMSTVKTLAFGDQHEHEYTNLALTLKNK